MAKDEVKVRVVLDTKGAKREMRNVVREGQQVAQKSGAVVGQSVQRGFGLARSAAAGVGLGAGIAAVGAASRSGFGSLIGESLGGFGAQLNELFFGSVDDAARAAKTAREETIATFGIVAGETGKVPPGAKEFFDQVKALRTVQEQGRSVIEKHSDFRGPGVEDLFNRFMDGIGELINKGFEALASALNPFD